MKKVLIGCIIFFLVLALALGGFMAYGVVTGGIGNWGDGNMFTAELANRQTFAASSVETLDIRYHSDSVTLIESLGDEIVLEEYMTDWDESMLATVTQNSDTLRFEAGQRPIRIGINIWYSQIKIYVPRDWKGNLNVSTSSGSIRSEDDWTFTTISASASSGSVRFENVTTEGGASFKASSGSVKTGNLAILGNLNVETTSGSIHVGDAKAMNITAKASSGSINFDGMKGAKLEAKNSSGSIRIGTADGTMDFANTSGSLQVEKAIGGGNFQSSSGSVRVTFETLSGDVTGKATSGTVRVNLPSDASFTFEASTSSGSIGTWFDDQLTFNERKNRATGQVGDGKYTVRLEASSGSVKVEKS